MKPVRCSWVDMQKVRAALSKGERGEQAALAKMLGCVDKTAISQWKAALDVIERTDGKVEISQLSTFQPSHATELARHLRRTVGKKPSQWDADVIADWVEKCEAEELTVEQFRAALMAKASAPLVAEDECCTAADLDNLAASGTKFGTIYADPPWAYSNQATRAATNNHYKQEQDTKRHDLTIDELCKMPVSSLAAEQSHLWLWTTNAFLFECPRLFAAWGFEFKSSFIWVKPQMGIGNYLRNSHEFLLLAVRGGLTAPDDARNVMSWGSFDRTEHSAKPEKVRSGVVEKLSPGPRLELFGRKLVHGWVVWGNEVDRDVMFTGEVREIA